jgi:lysozyme
MSDPASSIQVADYLDQSDAITQAIQVAAEICKPFEGLRLKPYICPAGFATIGYGTVYKPDGTQVTMLHPAITAEIAETWLMSELRNNYLPGVLKASPHLLLYPRILGLLTSFAYNCGVPRYRSSTLCRKVNQCDWKAAKTELMKWTRGGGQVLPGLVRRRTAECSYFPD